MSEELIMVVEHANKNPNKGITAPWGKIEADLITVGQIVKFTDENDNFVGVGRIHCIFGPPPKFHFMSAAASKGEILEIDFVGLRFEVTKGMKLWQNRGDPLELEAILNPPPIVEQKHMGVRLIADCDRCRKRRDVKERVHSLKGTTAYLCRDCFHKPLKMRMNWVRWQAVWLWCCTFMTQGYAPDWSFCILTIRGEARDKRKIGKDQQVPRQTPAT